MNNEQQQVQQQQQGGWFGGGLFKYVGIFVIINMIMSNFNQTPKTSSSTYRNIISPNEEFSFTMRSNVSDWTWNMEQLKYDTYTVHQNNITLTGEQLLQIPHIYIKVKSEHGVINTDFSLVQYLKVKKEIKKNLLFDSQEEYLIQKKDDNENSTYDWHYMNKAYVLFIHDTNQYPQQQIPPQLINKYLFDKNQEIGLYYTPYLDVDQFFLRRKDYEQIQLNQTYEIPIEFNCYWVWKYLMTTSIKDTKKTYQQIGLDGVMDEVQEDQIKEMLFETNIVLVTVTMIVSMLHTVFSTLAFKNDYQYWKNLESHEGISIRSLYTNFIIDIIITLYLFDNETSYLILLQQFVELGFSVWKIMKTTKFQRSDRFPFIKLKYQQDYQSTTQQLDSQASKYLYYILIPLFIGYLVYAVVYQEHKGVYSFILEAFVGFIYIFGFINMTPQLYINYKLKSVAHLPWRTMIYRFLNTIIDDLFAFIITMPWLKRLSCFRDDLIFLIYLYQRRIYKVDTNRVETTSGGVVTKNENQVETQNGEVVQKQKLD